MVEEFFLETTYVAKFLWRDDIVAAKHLLDCIIRQERLRPILEWHIEIAHGWSVKPGLYGRGLKRWLPAELWAELASTYTGAEVEANWEALWRIIALFRRVAVEVGTHLGCAYPTDLHRRAVAYLEQVRALDREARAAPDRRHAAPAG